MRRARALEEARPDDAALVLGELPAALPTSTSSSLGLALHRLAEHIEAAPPETDLSALAPNLRRVLERGQGWYADSKSLAAAIGRLNP
jgi:hypothetical protein